MLKLRLLTKPGSRSAKAIAKALNGLRVRFNGTYRPRPNHLVLNWGFVDKPRWWVGGLNSPEIVGRSSNKLSALSYLRQKGIETPDFTRSQEEAQLWVQQGKVVVGRKILNGHGGIGAVIFQKEENPQVQPCPLYTKHLRHKREFRIHVFKGQVIDCQEKLRERGFEGRDVWLRNHDKGYVFARENINVPEQLQTLAVQAVQALDLDFGAVDIGYREKEQQGYVFEVNTAPGLEGQTITSYVNAIRKALMLGILK